MPRNNLRDYARDLLGESRSGESVRTWMTLAATALVVLGGYLPWLRYNRDYAGVGIVLSPQVHPGFEGFDLLLVGPVGLLVTFLALRGPTKWWARATAVVGVLAVVLPTLAAVNSLVDPNPYYVPDVGGAVTALGGLLFLAVAGYDRYPAD